MSRRKYSFLTVILALAMLLSPLPGVLPARPALAADLEMPDQKYSVYVPEYLTKLTVYMGSDLNNLVSKEPMDARFWNQEALSVYTRTGCDAVVSPKMVAEADRGTAKWGKFQIVNLCEGWQFKDGVEAPNKKYYLLPKAASAKVYMGADVNHPENNEAFGEWLRKDGGYSVYIRRGNFAVVGINMTAAGDEGTTKWNKVQIVDTRDFDWVDNPTPPIDPTPTPEHTGPSPFDEPIYVKGFEIGQNNADVYVIGSDGVAHKIDLACDPSQQITVDLPVDMDNPLFGATMTYCQGSPGDKVEYKAALEIGTLLLTVPEPSTKILAAVFIGGSFLGVWIVTSAATIEYTEVVIQMARHSKEAHNPNKTGSVARTLITALLAGWASSGGGNHRCGNVVDRVTGAIVRYVIYVIDSSQPGGGYVSVIDPSNPQAPWVSSYNATQESYAQGPSQQRMNEANRYWDPDGGCPGGLPPLQNASY